MGRSRLLERESELAQLGELAVRAREGREGAVALLEGPPGVGKTELLGALGRIAEDEGLKVLTARGGELERGFAFGITRQLFEAPVATAAAAQRAELLAGAAELAAPLLDPSEAPGPGQPAADAFPLLHGLYWLCANLADRAPLALVVDDAHWADGPSLRFLHYLARRLEGVPALLAIAARSTSPEGPVSSIEEIKAEGACQIVRPTELSEPAAAELLGRLLRSEPAPELVREAHRASGGNPFLLRELGRSLAAEGLAPDAAAAEGLRGLTPETIQRSAVGRLAHLSAPARELAQAAALLDTDAEPRHVAALAGLGDDEALTAADELSGAGFLEVDRGAGTPKLRFVHPLIRQALYADLPAGERSRRHKQAARLIFEERGSSERAAAHLMETTPAAESWLVEALAAAASAAMAAGAPEIAASYLRRALAEPPAPEARAVILLVLGQAESQTLDPQAVVHLEAAASIAADPLQRAAALGTLAMARLLGEEGAAAFPAAREALEGVPPGAGGEPEAWLLGSAYFAARAASELVDDARALLERPRTGPDGEPTPAELVRVIFSALDAALRGGRQLPAERLRWVAEQPAEMRSILVTLGFVQAIGGFDRDAEGTLRLALERTRRSGDRLLVEPCLSGRGHVRWRGGDLAGAVTDAETLLDLTTQLEDGERDPATLNRAWAHILRAICLSERGDLATARSTVELPGELEARLPDTWMWMWLPFARGTLALALGEWTEASEQALAAGERALAIQVSSPDYMPWRSLAAQALARGGDRDRALGLAREELELARKEGSQRAIGIALTAVGTIEGGEVGLRALAEAVEALVDTPARLEHARALCARGSALRRAKRRADAREPLTAAIELARACGAVPLTERAHAELRATGARPRSLVFSGVESLTPREKQVAELAAEGRSNPEIAQELFVTRKTVEKHLGSVYGKLELDSREGLAEALTVEER